MSAMHYHPFDWGATGRDPAASSIWMRNPDAAASAHGACTRCRGHDDAREAVKAAAGLGLSVSSAPWTRPSGPVVTGTSVVAFKFRDGIIMATDCAASYGSLARFRNERRMMAAGAGNALVGVSGDMADYQFLQRALEVKSTEDHEWNDGHAMGPASVFRYLHRMMYNRRTNMKFLYNRIVVGGVQHDDNNKLVLGCIDPLGAVHEASTVATGFGAHLALPVLRSTVEGNESTIDETRARAIIDGVMRILFYRDARTINRIQVAVATADGVRISEPYSLATEWSFAESVCGYSGRTSDFHTATNQRRTDDETQEDPTAPVPMEIEGHSQQ